ncbi:MAG: DUF4174 domain-containing protein [Cyanobacteria bacterium P01_F01_bin.116]
MASGSQPFDMAKLTMKESASVDALMEEYEWQNRVLLVFAPETDNAALVEQTNNLSGMGAGMRARDLVVWQLVNNEPASVNGKLTSEISSQPFYDYFSVKGSDFTVILLGKDGTTKLRQTQPVTSHGLFSLIDAMPMRQREMRERGR